MTLEEVYADNQLLHLENDRLRAQVHRLQHNKHYEDLLKRLQFLLVENQQLHIELEENKELADKWTTWRGKDMPLYTPVENSTQTTSKMVK